MSVIYLSAPSILLLCQIKSLWMTSDLDFSLLSEFLKNATVEQKHAFLPTGLVALCADSLEFKDALFEVLELDTPSNVHVPSPVRALKQISLCLSFAEFASFNYQRLSS